MTPVCSVCDRRTGFGDEDKFEPPVNLARCPAPGGLECRAVAQAVAPFRVALETAQRALDALGKDFAEVFELAEERLAHAHQLQADLEAEQEGRKALLLRFGARDHETMNAWIERLATSTDEPDLFG